MAEVRSTLRLTRAAFPGQASLDTAFSHALLREVAQGRLADSLRVYQPDEVMAFSLLDRQAPAFSAAVAAARELGFEAVLRLAGGRAALFHRHSVAFAWCRRDPFPRRGIEARYREIADILVQALRGLGVDARVGEVPGEYCPGEYSVNARASVKLAGVGQRVVAGAAYLGGVVVVDDADRAREALGAVYRLLGLPLDGARIGSVAEEVAGIAPEGFAQVLCEEFGRRYALEEFEPSEGLLGAAAELVPRHEIGVQPSARNTGQGFGRVFA